MYSAASFREGRTRSAVFERPCIQLQAFVNADSYPAAFEWPCIQLKAYMKGRWECSRQTVWHCIPSCNAFLVLADTTAVMLLLVCMLKGMISIAWQLKLADEAGKQIACSSFI